MFMLRGTTEYCPFQVGDIVQRIKVEFRHVKVGDICEVEEIVSPAEIKVKGYSYGLSSSNFILIKKSINITVHRNEFLTYYKRKTLCFTTPSR